MTLKQIDQRLCLYKDYLRYRLDNIWHIHPRAMQDLYPERFYHWEQGAMLTFDQWLYQNGYDELIQYPPIKHTKRLVSLPLDDNNWAYKLWMRGAEQPTNEKRFFIPAYSVDKWGFPLSDNDVIK